ncbi:MAG: CvpA family protein [Lachnospiraceae bacterium]|nr:CvpA family protein [Lachnospiraceae bacterium]
MVGNITVVIIALILLLFTLYGARKGIIQVVFSLGSTLIAMWLVSYLTPYVTDFLKERTGVYDTVYEQISGAFAEENAKRDNTILENQIVTIESYSIPDPLKTLLKDNNTEEVYQNLLVSIFEDYVSTFLTDLLLNIIAYIFTFLIVMVILRLIIRSMNLLDNLPLLHGMNHFAGALAGFAEGLIVIWLIFLFMTAIIGTETGQRFYAIVQGNPVLRFLYNNNIFFHLLRNFHIGFQL